MYLFVNQSSLHGDENPSALANAVRSLLPQLRAALWCGYASKLILEAPTPCGGYSCQLPEEAESPQLLATAHPFRRRHRCPAPLVQCRPQQLDVGRPHTTAAAHHAGAALQPVLHVPVIGIRKDQAVCEKMGGARVWVPVRPDSHRLWCAVRPRQQAIARELQLGSHSAAQSIIVKRAGQQLRKQQLHTCIIFVRRHHGCRVRAAAARQPLCSTLWQLIVLTGKLLQEAPRAGKGARCTAASSSPQHSAPLLAASACLPPDVVVWKPLA